MQRLDKRLTLSLVLLLVLPTLSAGDDEIGRAAVPLPGVTTSASLAREPQPVGALPAPVYPEAAEAEGWEGSCKVRLRISAEGEILSAEIAVSSGREDTDQAALDAATSVAWRPGTDQAGKPLTQDVTLSFNFELSGEESD